MKTCIKCGFVGDVSLFAKKLNQCKQCISKHKKEYREKNKEKIREQQGKHYKKNKEKIILQISVWSLKNKDKKSVYNKKYRKRNVDKINTYHGKLWSEYRDNLDVRYIKKLLCNSAELKYLDIPPELIEMKRIEIAMLRELKNKQ